MADAAPSRRALQAQQTRHDIVGAARRLFTEQGYAATSVAQIARAAGVSVQTIYDSVGSKGAIVRLLNDLIDEEGGVGPLAARIPHADDPRELLRIAVAISRGINERCGDLLGALESAAAVGDDLATVRDEGRRRHRAGVGRLAGRLADLEALRDDLSVDGAADVIAALTDSPVARTFVIEYNWSWARWEAWTVQALATLVLAPAQAP